MRVWHQTTGGTVESIFGPVSEPEISSEHPESQLPYSELFGKPSGSLLYNTASLSNARITPLAKDFTPIYSLPDEVLGVIFDEGRRIITAKEGSLIIRASHVCRHWRNVVIHNSSLWNNIYYGPRFHSHEYTNACLERSRQCPLNITLHFCDAEHTWPLDKLIFHIEKIKSHSNRWRNLDIHAHFRQSLTILSRFPPSVPLLRRVRITLESDNLRYASCTMFNRGDPMLTSIELHGISFESIKLPIKWLTSLELTQSQKPLKSGEFRRLLTASSSIRELTLSGDVILLDGDLWSPVRIPTLTGLTLSPGSESPFRHICAMLILPALESVTLQHFSPDSLRIFVESFHLHTSTFSPMRTLELRSLHPLNISDVHVINLFEKFHMITQLSLIHFHSSKFTSLSRLHCSGSRRIIHSPQVHLNVPHIGSLFGLENESHMAQYSDPPSLTSRSVQPATPILLPNLNTIGIVPIDENNVAHLCDLLSSRATAERAISYFKTSSYDRIPSDRLQWLKEHVKLERI